MTAQALRPAQQQHPWALSDCPACLLAAFWVNCPPADPDCPLLLDAEIHAAAAEALL